MFGPRPRRKHKIPLLLGEVVVLLVLFVFLLHFFYQVRIVQPIQLILNLANTLTDNVQHFGRILPAHKLRLQFVQAHK